MPGKQRYITPPSVLRPGGQWSRIDAQYEWFHRIVGLAPTNVCRVVTAIAESDSRLVLLPGIELATY
jgi:hypothetical protein